MNPFQNKTKKPAVEKSALAISLESISSMMNQNSFVLTEKVAHGAMALEGIDDEVVGAMDAACEGLQASLESIFQSMEVAPGKQQRKAAQIAAMMTGGVSEYVNGGVALEDFHNAFSKEKNTDMVVTSGGNVLDNRRMALEAYDEKELKNSAAYSVAWNLNAPRQDAFGELFFPTITLNPDQVGYQISIRLVQVYPELRRSIDGAVNDIKARSIIQALIDPSIMRSETLVVYPVYRTESASHFVDTNLLPTRTVVVDGEEITTSAMKFDNAYSLLGISQTQALLDTGLMDSTDALDAAISLKNLYLNVGATGSATGNEVFKFKTDMLPLANFVSMQQDDYRMMQLTFITQALQISPKTLTVGATPSVLLKAITDNNVSVRLQVTVTGTVNVELGTTNLFASKVGVVSVTNEDGELLSLTQPGVGKDVYDLFANTAALGYDLSANRTNSNRRQRGQLLRITYQNQAYNIPLRAPITIPRPQMIGDQNDASDLAALISATRARISNDAVSKLLETAAQLKELSSQNDLVENNLPILGVARHLVTAFYDEIDLDVAATLNNLTSNQKYDDISATLVNTLRDLVYRMLTLSGYQAAADALSGGIAPMPTILIGTDPKTARYLLVTGDMRTLGSEVNVEIRTTLNLEMRNKIIVAFGQPNASDGTPNPLHFGNMVWKPELTLIMPTQRNGSNSKEITVTPSYNHIVNTPIMGVINVSGISEAVAAKSVITNHVV